MSVVSLLALVVKEVGLEGVSPFRLGGCSSVIPAVDKGEVFRVAGLIKSHKWLVVFGLSSEICCVGSRKRFL